MPSPLGTPRLYTGMPRTCASRRGLSAINRAPRTVVRANNACRPINRLHKRSPAGTRRRKVLRAFERSQIDIKTPVRKRTGVMGHYGRLLYVGQADAHTFQITEAATHPCRPVLAEAQVHSEAQRELHVAPAAGTQHGEDHGVRVRGKGGMGPFQLEPTPEAEAHRQVNQIVTIADVKAGSHGQRAIEREALTVVQHPGTETPAQ